MRQKSELISQVKLREACFLVPDYWSVLPDYWSVLPGYCLLVSASCLASQMGLYAPPPKRRKNSEAWLSGLIS